MSAVVREIVATEWIERAWPLLEAHREELTTNPDLMVLKPDVARYQTLEAAGAMLSLGLFKGDDLVGYSINNLFTHSHYGGLLVCQNELLFLAKAHRRGMAGVRLIAATEEIARERGADIMLWHAKPRTTLDRMLPRMGYRTQDIVYSQVL
jgi:GNAT superfamily N-acetyltransferase